MRLRTFLVCLTLATALLACQQRAPAPAFYATDITGASFGRGFDLTDFNGKRRTLADFHGKVVALFFGYTHCPDVCPTTMSDFALALKAMGADAARVQVLFVTVDPERDTPALLRQYVPAFNPGFLGLTTDPVRLAALAREYKVVYQKTPGKTADDYSIDHSASTYVYDARGRLRLLMAYGSTPVQIAHDLSALLGEPGG
jgi:protein SCO1/2